MRLAATLLLGVTFLLAGCSDSNEPSAETDPGSAERGAASTDALDAEAFVAEFRDAGLPIGESVVWDEDTDPNEALGRPGQYTGKATWIDNRAEPCFNGNPNWECGGDVEVFKNDNDLNERFGYLEGFATTPPLGGYYMWKADNAIIRVGYALTPSEAATYEEALRTFASSVEALDVDS